MTISPVNLSNDINRLATINIIGLAITNVLGNKMDFKGWKNNLLRDIGILMVYHQLLSYIPKHLELENQAMAGDLIKTSALLLTPSLLELSMTSVNWNQMSLTLGGVVVYHKFIRPQLVAFMNANNIGYDEIVEDMVETVLLLSLTRGGIKTATAQLAGIIIYHMYLKWN